MAYTADMAVMVKKGDDGDGWVCLSLTVQACPCPFFLYI